MKKEPLKGGSFFISIAPSKTCSHDQIVLTYIMPSASYLLASPSIGLAGTKPSD
jgi:hypothetical protein